MIGFLPAAQTHPHLHFRFFEVAAAFCTKRRKISLYQLETAGADWFAGLVVQMFSANKAVKGEDYIQQSGKIIFKHSVILAF